MPSLTLSVPRRRTFNVPLWLWLTLPMFLTPRMFLMDFLMPWMFLTDLVQTWCSSGLDTNVLPSSHGLAPLEMFLLRNILPLCIHRHLLPLYPLTEHSLGTGLVPDSPDSPNPRECSSVPSWQGRGLVSKELPCWEGVEHCSSCRTPTSETAQNVPPEPSESPNEPLSIPLFPGNMPGLELCSPKEIHGTLWESESHTSEMPCTSLSDRVVHLN